jgi:signal transduction histidine kinase
MDHQVSIGSLALVSALVAAFLGGFGTGLLAIILYFKRSRLNAPAHRPVPDRAVPDEIEPDKSSSPKNSETALREKDQIIRFLVHEFRNALASILSSAQLLTRHATARPALVPSVSGGIERQVKQLSGLLGTLSDLMRIARNELELKPRTTALNLVLSRSVEACRPMIENNQQELSVRLAEQSPELAVDAERIAQAVDQLLINASKFTPPQGRIELSSGREENHALIAVRDTGIGIDEDSLERIFEPFIQLERPLHGGQKGLGIGLPFARSLVELHGGKLSATSAGKGLGSEFKIRLPLR